jgi:hypothetical protein
MCCLHLHGGSDKAEKWRAKIGLEEGRLGERGQLERRNMEKRIWTNREPSSRLQRERERESAAV